MNAWTRTTLRRIGMALRSESPGAPSSASRFIESQHRVTLDECGFIDAESIDDYLAHGGYSALTKALQSDAQDVINQVKDSRLRGRGGAYFPAGLKWESARSFSADRRYLIVNCEEGEPGLFKDRHLMEGAPHRLIEGACIAAYACDAQDVIFYINAEANLSALRVENASQSRPKTSDSSAMMFSVLDSISTSKSAGAREATCAVRRPP